MSDSCYTLSASNSCCCDASCSYTELNWKLNDSASFLGLGRRTTVGVDSPSSVSAVTMVSLSSSCLSSGLIRATTRTLMMFTPDNAGRVRKSKRKKCKGTNAREQAKHAAYRDVGSIYRCEGHPGTPYFALTASLLGHHHGNSEKAGHVLYACTRISMANLYIRCRTRPTNDDTSENRIPGYRSIIKREREPM